MTRQLKRIIFWLSLSLGSVILYELLIFGTWWPLQHAVNNSIDGTETSVFNFWFMALAVCYLLQPFLFWLLDYCKYNFALEVKAYYRNKAVEEQAMNAIAPNHHLTQAEQITQIQNMDTTSGAVVSALLQILPSLIRLISLLIAFYFFSLTLGYIGSAGVILVLLLVWLMLPFMRKMAAEYFEDEVKLRKAELKRIEEYPIKFTLGQEQSGAEMVKQLNANLVYAERFRHARWNNVILTFHLVPTIIMICLIGFALSLIQSQQITVGILYVIMSWSSMYNQNTKDIQNLANQIISGQLSWNNFKKAFQESLELQNTYLKWPDELIGNFKLRNVSVSFPDLKKKVLNNISLDIPIGSCLVVMSPSGGGKTTLLSLLQSSCHYTGSIKMDSVELKEMDSIKYRSNCIGVVLQDLFLFNGTVYENIAIANPSATLEDVESLLKRFGFNNSEQDQLDLSFEVGEFGKKLSGGQKQRLAIARSLIRDSVKLLLLDEPTSALDDENAHIVIRELSAVAKKEKKTIVVATHDQRFKEAEGFQVLELKDGQIVHPQAA
jgi:ABC-type bacteriocin/lantibiotic exporter with double-glycine peptidase domain